MAIVVRIPTPLQKFTKQQSAVETTGTTIQDMLDELGRHFPGLRDQRCDERGAMRKFVNLSLNKPTVSPLMIPLVYCHINSFQRASSVEKPLPGGEKRI